MVLYDQVAMEAESSLYDDSKISILSYLPTTIHLFS